MPKVVNQWGRTHQVELTADGVADILNNEPLRILINRRVEVLLIPDQAIIAAIRRQPTIRLPDSHLAADVSLTDVDLLRAVRRGGAAKERTKGDDY